MDSSSSSNSGSGGPVSNMGGMGSGSSVKSAPTSAPAPVTNTGAPASAPRVSTPAPRSATPSGAAAVSTPSVTSGSSSGGGSSSGAGAPTSGTTAAEEGLKGGIVSAEITVTKKSGPPVIRTERSLDALAKSNGGLVFGNNGEVAEWSSPNAHRNSSMVSGVTSHDVIQSGNGGGGDGNTNAAKQPAQGAAPQMFGSMSADQLKQKALMGLATFGKVGPNGEQYVVMLNQANSALHLDKDDGWTGR